MAYGGIQGRKVMEHQPLDVGIDRAVHQFYRILHKCLVLRMACPCREDCHVVEFGHCCKVLIDDGFVAVTSRDCRLQVVRHDGHRRTAEEVKGILAGHDEVLLLLRPDSLTVGVVAARKDGNEHLHKTNLASLRIHNLQLVTRVVYVHLISGKVIHMADDPHMVLLPTDGTLEG